MITGYTPNHRQILDGQTYRYGYEDLRIPSKPYVEAWLAGQAMMDAIENWLFDMECPF